MATYARIKDSCRHAPDGFTTASGGIEAPLQCHLICGTLSGPGPLDVLPPR